jgi:tRNA nucleotidyltransferase (CCA-adding enzyme)
MEKTLPQALFNIAGAFARHNREVRLVGGAVRDIVMGKQPKDWDMATNALPQRTMEILEEIGKPYDLSNGHGTISIQLDGETYEITTLRVDAETDGRHAKVEFVNDWKLDAARRDFTFNAMSMDVLTGEIFDYFAGQIDLLKETVRFVGDPAKRIQEDYLRILRYFRFIGKMGFFEIDRDAFAAVRDNRAGLAKVSGERVWMEVKQMMAMECAAMLVQQMQVTGVWEQVTQ